MCARKSSHKLAGTSDGNKHCRNKPADVNFSSSASYRVLRGGRQRPSRSVDREAVSRNASEAVELRHISRVWVSKLYIKPKTMFNPSGLGPIGVQVHGVLPKLMGEPRRSRSQVEKEYEVSIQEFTFKKPHTPLLEVRWPNISWEVG